MFTQPYLIGGENRFPKAELRQPTGEGLASVEPEQRVMVAIL